MNPLPLDTATGQVTTRRQLVEAGIADADAVPPRPYCATGAEDRRPEPSPAWREALALFDADLRRRGAAEKTRRAYNRCLHRQPPGEHGRSPEDQPARQGRR